MSLLQSQYIGTFFLLIAIILWLIQLKKDITKRNSLIKALENLQNPPILVQVLAKFIPILKWEDEENLAKGEIEKFNFVESCRNQHKFNDQVVGSRGGYDMIWRHVADDWFKLIGKSPERSC